MSYALQTLSIYLSIYRFRGSDFIAFFSSSEQTATKTSHIRVSAMISDPWNTHGIWSNARHHN